MNAALTTARWSRTSPRIAGVGRALAFAIIAAATVAIGCGGAPEQTNVTGKITFDGEPVANGQIEFEPQGAGRMAFAAIADGAYATAKDRGVRPGKYLVRITATRPTGKSAELGAFAADAASAVVNEQFIPTKYNSSSEISVEIAPGEAMVQDFELKSN